MTIDLFIIMTLTIATVGLCLLSWWQDGRIEQLEGYIKRLEWENDHYKQRLHGPRYRERCLPIIDDAEGRN